jgi:hypothetical protein
MSSAIILTCGADGGRLRHEADQRALAVLRRAQGRVCGGERAHGDEVGAGIVGVQEVAAVQAIMRCNNEAMLAT